MGQVALASAPAANLEGDTPEAKAKTERVRKVAEAMGLDPKHFYYGGPSQKTEIAGMSGETLGVTFPQPEIFNGKRYPPGVVIFDPPEGADISDATIAHEGMHVKFNAVMHGMAEEAEKITPSMVHADGTLLDDPGLKKEFPIYDLLSPFIAWGFKGKAPAGGRLPQGLQVLAREDGVTPYSRAYWEQWYEARGNMDPWLPINETLAEIANVHYAKPGEGGMPEGYEASMQGATPLYQRLYKAMNDAYEIVKQRGAK